MRAAQHDEPTPELVARRFMPTLAGRRSGVVDMEGSFLRWRLAHPERFVPGGRNPYLDPVVAMEIMDEIHRIAGVEWSFGGYLEERRWLLAGAYLEAERKFLHLGVDFHVPQGTPVAAAAPAEVLRVDDDQDPDGGWGPRVFLHRRTAPDDDIVALFAHLQTPRCRPGDELAPGDVLAKVGGPPGNGNWHPHLHLQLLRLATYEEIFVARSRELDGYGDPTRRDELAKLFPDPLKEW